MKKLIGLVVACLSVSAAAYAYHDHKSNKISCYELIALAESAMAARQSDVNKFVVRAEISEFASDRKELKKLAYDLVDKVYSQPIHEKTSDKKNAAFDFSLSVGRECARNQGD